MSGLAEKQENFIVNLISLGSLLAVFLAFVINQSTPELAYLVIFGILFAVSALYEYSILLFASRHAAEEEWFRSGRRLAHVLLAGSFSGLIFIGLERVVALLVPGSGWLQTALAVPYVLVTLGVFALVDSAMTTGTIMPAEVKSDQS